MRSVFLPGRQAEALLVYLSSLAYLKQEILSPEKKIRASLG